MIKVIKKGIFLLLFINIIVYAKTPNNSVVIDRMLMSNTLKKITFEDYLPGKNKYTFTNKDKNIVYYVYFGIINSTKEKYEIELFCIDTKSNIIFKESIERTLVEFPDYMGEDIIKNQDQMLLLDPKPGAMVKGQLMPLKDGNSYYIKLYIDKKLSGVSKFTYRIDE